MSRVVVVGGGVGGIAAAVRLAVAGHSVTLLERNDVVGGKVALYERDGFSFDIGPALVTMPHVLDELFRTAGTSLDDEVGLVRLDPQFRYSWRDGSTLEVPDDPEETVHAFERFAPGAGARWSEFDQRGRRIWEVAERTFLAGPMSGAASLLKRMRSPADLARIDGHRTLRGVVRSTFDDDRLRQWGERYATYSGSSPAAAPATLACIAHVESRFGVWYPMGGVRALRDALERVARDVGVEIETGAEVVAVTSTPHRVTGVELADGSFLDATVVVSNADAHHLYSDLLPDQEALESVRRAPRSTSGFAMSIGVSGRTDGIRHHNVWFPNDIWQEFRAIGSGQLALDPTIYASVSSTTDPSQAPDGDENWFVLVNTPARRRHRRGALPRHRPRPPRRPRGRSADPDGVLRDHDPRRHRAQLPLTRRRDLRHLLERGARRLPAPRQPRAARGPVPRRRIEPPRGRSAPRGHQRSDRGRSGRRRPPVTARSGSAGARRILRIASVAGRVAAGLVAGRRLAQASRPEPPVTVTAPPVGVSISVVVPARDEALRIGPVLAAMSSAPRVDEVIVVDDESGDDTAAVASAAGARVVPGAPLPVGWAGKAWALQQGIEAATSEWVVTLDADTRPDPHLPGSVVARARDRYDLLTVGGRFECPTPPSRWLHAAMLTTLVYRFGPPGGRTRPERTMASGQCTVVRRDDFLRAGGMAIVAGEVVEDVALARAMAVDGRRVGFLAAPDLISVRMYESLGGTWSGWGRSLALPGVESRSRQLADLAVVVLTQALPLPRLLTGRGDLVDAVLLALRCGTLVGTRTAFGVRGAAYWLSPTADLAAAAAIARGIAHRGPRSWRGRDYT
ncbi:phytoene desaturase family protein [Ilumatobacter sp.]|uniref:phytoene desaturase family protein n=1 Tax=Ilumatobacter sp. TaxID=1967498 RepID=UPI003B528F79